MKIPGQLNKVRENWNFRGLRVSVEKPISTKVLLTTPLRPQNGLEGKIYLPHLDYISVLGYSFYVFKRIL